MHVSLTRIASAVMLGALAVQLDTTMTNVALDTLLREFDAPIATIQWVGTAYLLAMAMVIPLSGWAVDRYGAKRVWLASLAAFLAGSLLCGIAWSAPSLIAFRVVQGLGGGMLLPLAQTILAQAAGPERLGRLMAAIGVPVMLGPVLGPVLGGLIVDDLSWRWIFFANIPVCLAAVALSWWALPEGATSGRARLDALGLALLSPGCAALVYGLAEAGRSGGFTAVGVLAPLALGVALLAGFVRHALRPGVEPLIDVRLLRDRAFAASSGVVFFAGFALFGAVILLPLFYQQVRGDSATQAGLLMGPQGLGLGIALIVAGRLSDRIGPRPLVLTGLGLTALGTLAFTQADADTSSWLLAVTLAVRGAGVGATLVPVLAGAIRTLAPERIPRASTAVRIFQQLGSSFGGAVLAVVLQHQVTAGTDLTRAFNHTFWWVLGFVVIGVGPALLLPATIARSAESERAELVH